MIKLLDKLPRFFVAVVAISLGVAFILSQDPPKTLCDTSLEHFQSLQRGNFEALSQTCARTNSAGACYPMFSNIQKFIRSFYLVPQTCTKDLKNLPEVRSQLFQSFELMVLLSWREEALKGQVSKFHWLSQGDRDLFCKLKKWIVLFYDHSSLDTLEKSLLDKMPASEGVTDKQKRKFSVLSEYCPL